MKKTVSVLLLAALAANTLIGCGSGSANPSAISDGTDTSAQDTEITDADMLGFPKEDNGGKTFTILVAENRAYEYAVEETSGDVVNDAVYEKNRTVEDYLGIEFAFRVEATAWNTREQFSNMIIQDVMSDSKSFDLVNSATVSTISTASSGVFLEGGSLPFVQFDRSWWMADMYSRFSIDGKLYGFIGDASLSLYKDMTAIFFNKRIWEEFKKHDPYELVRSGEWTLDKMIELTVDMVKDLDGNGIYAPETDQMAWYSEVVPNGTFQTSLQLEVVRINDEGTPEYLGLTERFSDAYDKMYAFYQQPGVASRSTIDDKSYHTMKTFAQGTVATMCNFIYSTEYLRDMKDDYGILPMPKYDETQEKYISQVGTSTSMLFVPLTTNDAELTSKVMEACAYYTNQLVVPRYYEVALKEKYARDSDVAEMLDLIREGAAFDFLFVYGAGCLSNAPNLFFRKLESTDLASEFAGNKASFVASLEDLIEIYQGLGE